MKIKLIQTGGFAGKIKTAEEDLDQHHPVLQDHVAELFDQEPAENPKSQVRDKEQLFLEFNGKTLPLHQLKMNPQLEKIIAGLNEKLCFKK